MGFRRRLARFNRVVTNPIQGSWAWLAPPWAVLVHRGRRSGRVYRTPVLALVRDRRIRVLILYGERSDWVLNLLAGGGEVVRRGHTYPLLDPSVVHGSFGVSLVGTLGDPSPGFGRGPAAAR